MSIPITPPRGPAENRAVARQLGYRGADSLYVLARNNDPYGKGTDAHVRDAEWFAQLWHAFGYSRGVHLRRVHYQILSHSEITLPSGQPYENTQRCWEALCMAAAAARILELVDVEAFVDRRNSPARIFREQPDALHETTPTIGFTDPEWKLPTFDLEELQQVELQLPEPFAAGYSYHPDDQPVLVEVWVEKSTMADVLVPVCRNNHVNYVEGAGFESITHVVELVRRAERHGRPAHVLYVSDFDPAGDAMPVAVARQIQYWRETLGVAEDISVDPIVLTHDQTVEYRLPRAPIKDGDRRAGGFEERYGEGATELDALEALHPGALAGIIRQAIREFQDPMLPARLSEARLETNSVIDQVWEPASEPLRAEAERLTAEAREVIAEHLEEITAFVSERLASLGPFEERARELVEQAERLAATLDIELPPRPEPEIDPPLGGVLFDSRRYWLDQLDIFKERKNGGAA